MTMQNIESWLNKGLITDDEASRLLLKVIDARFDAMGEPEEPDDFSGATIGDR